MKERMKTNDPIQTEICNSTKKKENCSKSEIYFYSFFFRFEVITLFFLLWGNLNFILFSHVFCWLFMFFIFFSQGGCVRGKNNKVKILPPPKKGRIR